MVVGLSEADGADEVDQLAKASLVEALAGVVAGKDTPDDGILLLNEVHGRVDVGADGRQLGASLDRLPSSIGGDPEDVVGGVLVAVFEEVVEAVGGDAFGSEFGFELASAGGEAVGDVLEEHQTEDNVLVLAGLLVATESVSGLPQALLQ